MKQPHYAQVITGLECNCSSSAMHPSCSTSNLINAAA